MKKMIVLFILVTISILFSACNSCTKMSKNLESDWGDLERVVTVTSIFTGDTLFHYDGPCYISEGSTGTDVRLIYYIGKKAKKADFIGNGFNFVAIEK